MCFKGRFNAVVMDEKGYLLGLSREAVLNPVRAEMVADGQDWPWSSYGATVGTTALSSIQSSGLMGHLSDAYP
jgi:hypothetical protein